MWWSLWLLMCTVIFLVIVIISAFNNDWNTAVIALFAECYFVNQAKPTSGKPLY